MILLDILAHPLTSTILWIAAAVMAYRLGHTKGRLAMLKAMDPSEDQMFALATSQAFALHRMHAHIENLQARLAEEKAKSK